MAHSSAYKPPVKLPEADQQHINRALAKGSALIETTDDVFGEIKNRLEEYNQSVSALLRRSSEIYEKLTGEVANPSSALGELIADTYRELLKDVTPDQLEAWTAGRSWIGGVLKTKRGESVFYRDAIVILLGFLVSANQTSVPRQWPVDAAYLEDFYTTLGISTSGLF